MTCPRPGTVLPAPRGPRVITWYGRATGRWWALVPWPSAPHGALLVEAPDQATLNEHVAHLLAAFRSRTGTL
ncbi:hypothetical protein ACIBI3_36225 [Actinomadura luteofluorescens]|uniref:hypothetical protein n=1 Tax=Actinomadura luteofluorescens TaxID=46163 RepID=UPI00347B5989